jgi:hypothetical protein
MATLRCIMSAPERLAQELCKGDIPADRARRGAVTCSDSCAREYGRQRRSEHAQKKCRLCGRRFRRREL